MSREGVALPGTGAPAQEYDRMNEAQYRAAIEQALGRLSAAIREIEELSDDLTITGAWTFDPGPVVVGTDPGGSEKLRVGGDGAADGLKALGGASTGFTGAGNVAIKRSNNNPLLSFHAADGSRIGFLQIRDAASSILNVLNTQDLEIRTNGFTRMTIKADGNIIMHALPTSDPTVAGALWNDSGTLKVSSG